MLKYASGAESGDTSQFKNAGAAVIESSVVYRGFYSYRHPQSSSQSIQLAAGFDAPTFYTRHYGRFHVTTPPSVDTTYVYVSAETAAAAILNVNLRVTTGSALSLILRNFVTSTDIGSPYVVLADTWYLIETKTVISATVGVLELKVNESVVATGSSQNTGSTNIDTVYGFSPFAATLNSLVADCYSDEILCGTDAYFGAIPAERNFSAFPKLILQPNISGGRVI